MRCFLVPQIPQVLLSFFFDSYSLDTADITVVDTAPLCSLSTPTQVCVLSICCLMFPKTILGVAGQYRPYGWLEIGTVIDGWILLVSRECILTPLPLAASPLTAILLQFSKMSLDGADANTLTAVAQFIQLFPTSLREYLIGLFSSWIRSDLLIDEVKRHCDDMRLLTEADLHLSQRTDLNHQKLVQVDNFLSGLTCGMQLVQHVHAGKYLRCNNLFGTISSVEADEVCNSLMMSHPSFVGPWLEHDYSISLCFTHSR